MGNQGCCSRSRTQSFTGTGTLYRSSRINDEDSILSLTSYSPFSPQESPSDSPVQKRMIHSTGALQTPPREDQYGRRKTDLPKALVYKNINRLDTTDPYSQRSCISNDFGGDVQELNTNISNIFSKPSDGRDSEVFSVQNNTNMVSSQARQPTYFHQFLESKNDAVTPVNAKVKISGNLEAFNHSVKHEHQMTPMHGHKVDGLTPKFNNADTSSMCELVILGSRAL